MADMSIRADNQFGTQTTKMFDNYSAATTRPRCRKILIKGSLSSTEEAGYGMMIELCE